MKQIVATEIGEIYQDWRVVPFSDYVFFQEGPGLRSWQFRTSGMKVINGRNILEDGSIDLSNTSRHVELNEFHERYSHFAVDAGDIVVASSGTYGKVGRIDNDHLPLMMNTSVIRMRSKSKNALLDDYLLYFLKSRYFQDQVEQAVTGTAQKNFGPSHLKRMLIILPPLPTQRKIASILSAYDDLIENNTRRIAILEEMAQSLYREWFVHYRYPGHEHVPLVDSPIGPVPEGWDVVGLGDTSRFVMGQSPKSEFYNQDGTGLPFHQGVRDFGHRYPVDRVYCTVTDRLAEQGDILFSVRAPVGRINIATKTIVIGRGLAAIRSKSENQAFLYHQLREAFQEEDIIGNGAIFKAVTKKDMLDFPVIQPIAGLVEQFECHAEPMSRYIRLLTMQTDDLRQTRDLLLPKLISGEVDVTPIGGTCRHATS